MQMYFMAYCNFCKQNN